MIVDKSGERNTESNYLEKTQNKLAAMLFEKDAVQIDSDILENSRNSIETVVKMGHSIGCAIQ